MNNLDAISLQVAARFRSELRLKLFLMVVLNVWVYLPYHLLQEHHFFRPIAMRACLIDERIPFWDKTVWIYLSIYLLMPIGPFLMNRREQILRYAMGVVLIGLTADFVFVIWPTFCPRPMASGTIAAYRFLTAVDNSFHACPSLHAAFAVYSALCAGRVLDEVLAPPVFRIGILMWALLILLATLTTHQHVLVDIVAGGALGLAVYFVVFRQSTSVPKLGTLVPRISSNTTQPKSTVL